MTPPGNLLAFGNVLGLACNLYPESEHAMTQSRQTGPQDTRTNAPTRGTEGKTAHALHPPARRPNPSANRWLRTGRTRHGMIPENRR